MKKILNSIANFIENGDLIPVLIAVSVPHYATVLAQYDFWVVAAIIGFLVDIGHYRTIKTFLKGNGYGWMIVLSVFSLGFHVAFYALGNAGWWSLVLGCAPPAVIFSLAYISKKEGLDKKLSKSDSVTTSVTIPQSVKTPAKAKPFQSYTEYKQFVMSRNGTGSHEGHVLAKELIELGQPQATAYVWVNRLAEQHPDVYTPVKKAK